MQSHKPHLEGALRTWCHPKYYSINKASVRVSRAGCRDCHGHCTWDEGLGCAHLEGSMRPGAWLRSDAMVKEHVSPG